MTDALSRLERLPSELKCLVLVHLPDISALKSAVHASPVLHATYRSNRTTILRAIMRRELGGCFVDAVAHLLTSPHGLESPRDKSDILVLLRQYQTLLLVNSPDLIMSVGEADWVRMVMFYVAFVRPVARRYPAWALENLEQGLHKHLGPRELQLEILHGCTASPLSGSEEVRLLRAIYRFEVYHNLFGRHPTIGDDHDGDSDDGDEDCSDEEDYLDDCDDDDFANIFGHDSDDDEDHDNDNDEYFHGYEFYRKYGPLFRHYELNGLFFGLFEPWEAEAIASVECFARERYSAFLKGLHFDIGDFRLRSSYEAVIISLGLDPIVDILTAADDTTRRFLAGQHARIFGHVIRSPAGPDLRAVYGQSAQRVRRQCHPPVRNDLFTLHDIRERCLMPLRFEGDEGGSSDKENEGSCDNSDSSDGGDDDHEHDPSRDQHDDDDSGNGKNDHGEFARPPLAWVLLWRGHYVNYYGDYMTNCLRRWGGLVWDEARWATIESQIRVDRDGSEHGLQKMMVSLWDTAPDSVLAELRHGARWDPTDVTNEKIWPGGT